MTIYEQPLHEKTRVLLRLEQLVRRFNFHILDDKRASSEAALLLLLEMYNLAARLDLKSEILKEIDRQALAVKYRQKQGEIDKESADDILETLTRVNTKLYTLSGPLGQRLKNHGFFNVLRQRSSLPGGINGFDIPMLQHWLNKPATARCKDLIHLVEAYRLANDAIQVILLLIRGCSAGTEHIAKHGFFQATLSQRPPKQLLRVEIADDVSYYPEISAGKQRFSVRFVEIKTLEERGKQVMEDINFKLTLCSF
jgi:cell division protein ZapD